MRTLKIMMHAHLARSYRERLESIIGRPWSYVDPEDDGADATDVEIALLSRSIYGDSNRTSLSVPTRRFMEAVTRSTSLAWLHIFASGTDNRLFTDLPQPGIQISSSVGAGGGTVALTAFASLLAMSRGMLRWIADKEVRAWRPVSGAQAPNDLSVQRAVIIGTGAIGQEFARLCQSVDLDCIGVRRNVQPTPPFRKCVPVEQLDALLPDTDWLVLACPLTPSTRGLLGQKRLARLPAHAHVINVARGGVVVENDLIDALVKHQIAGAYLDVFETEPLPSDSPLWSLPNVLLSPHNAAASRQYDDRVMDTFLDNLRRYVSGQPLKNVHTPSTAKTLVQ